MIKSISVAVAGALMAAACAPSSDSAELQPLLELDRSASGEVAPVDTDRAEVISAPLLRSYLQNLLTAHSDLTIQAMREATAGEQNATTIERLRTNTDDLTRAIGLVYGPDGATAFDQLWASHIEFFNVYANASGNGDDDAIAEARKALDHYEEDFSSYVEVATSGNADFHSVLHVLHGHVSQLLDQADLWADSDFAGSVAMSTEAHRHMDVIAHALAVGISTQQPAAFPGDPSATQASHCAAMQLETSLLISIEHQIAEASRSGDKSAVTATSSELANVRAQSTELALDLVGGSSGTTDERLAQTRAALAESEGCAGLVLG